MHREGHSISCYGLKIETREAWEVRPVTKGLQEGHRRSSDNSTLYEIMEMIIYDDFLLLVKEYELVVLIQP